MRNYKTEGIIIRRRNYKDSDRILTVITKNNGKIYIKATGVRKINSRRAGHIELLNHAVLNLYQGKSFPVLTEAVSIDNFSNIKKDLRKVGIAYHLCELVDGLCPENQENTQVFELLRETLSRLSRSVILSEAENLRDPSATPKDDMQTMINGFEMQLLTILGYWNKSSFATLDTQDFIEQILERRLKSRNIFSKIQ